MTIIQIIRIFSIKNLTSYTDSATVIMWSVIEISLGVSCHIRPQILHRLLTILKIIVPCIPTYAPLVRSMAISSGLGSSSGPSRPWQSSNTPRRSTLRNGGGSGPGGGKSNKFSAIGSTDVSYDMNAFTTVITNHHHQSERSSEEAIIHRDGNDPSQNAGDASRDERFQIRTTTEVKVESHKLDEDDESDLSHRL